MAAGTNSIFRRELRQSLISCHLLFYTLILTLSPESGVHVFSSQICPACDSYVTEKVVEVMLRDSQDWVEKP